MNCWDPRSSMTSRAELAYTSRSMDLRRFGRRVDCGLPRDVLDCWVVDLDALAARLAHSLDEGKDGASRRPVSRRRQIASYAALNMGLCALDCPDGADDLTVSRGWSGKLRVNGSRDIDASLSRYGRWGCIAMGKHVRVGCDIEGFPLPRGANGLIVRYGSRDWLRAYLLADPGSPRSTVAAAWWVQTEALLKGLGLGLAGLDMMRAMPEIFHDWTTLMVPVRQDVIGCVAWIGS